MIKRLGVIGHHISYSMSPAIHAWIAKTYALSQTYEVFDVGPDGLEPLIDGLKTGLYHGFNVTKPYKEAIIRFTDELTPVAKAVRAVNTLTLENGTIIGDNTDVAGFNALLDSTGITIEGKECVVLGNGGAAKAVVYALNMRGISPIIAVRDVAKAIPDFDRVMPISQLPSLQGKIVINCTPVGTFPDVHVSVLDDRVVKDAYVIDLIYHPLRTQLIKDAGKGSGGAMMLCVQALESAMRFHRRHLEFSHTMLESIGGSVL